MGGALSLNCSKISSSWRGALGIGRGKRSGRGSVGARVLVQVFAVFGVGFALKSKLKMTCGAGKNRAKNGNKKKRKTPIKSRLFRIFLLTNSAECDIINNVKMG